MNKLTGQCYLCGNEYSKSGMTRHMKSCLSKLQEHSDEERYGYVLKIIATYSPEYWLYLYVDEDVTLNLLDDYIRKIWVECCGHLSCFIVGDEYFNSDENMDVTLKSIFKYVDKIQYDYDFGSTTHLAIETISKTVSFCNKIGIHLLARNHNLHDMPNSPRAGVCGYDDLAEDILYMSYIENNINISKNKKVNNVIQLFPTKEPDWLERDSENYKDEEFMIETLLSNFEEDAKDALYASLQDVVIDSDEIDDESLIGYLYTLDMYNLNEIRKEVLDNIKVNLPKRKLIQAIEESILSNLYEICLYMPTEYFELTANIVQDDMYVEEEDNLIILEKAMVLRKMGLAFLVNYDKEIYPEIPEDIIDHIDAILTTDEFQKEKLEVNRIENLIVNILLNWGVVEAEKLFNTVSKMLDGQQISLKNTKFITKVMKYLEKFEITNTFTKLDSKYYHIKVEEPEKVIDSISWKNRKYPALFEEDFINTNTFINFLGNNEKINILREVIKDIYDAVQDEEQLSGFELFLWGIEEFVALCMNASSRKEQIEFLNDLVEELDIPIEIQNIFEDLLEVLPNYYCKGYPIS